VGSMFFKAKSIHFIGIGGIGMSGIAEILLNLGYRISGSDLRLSPITERLAGMGALIFEGHRAEQVDDSDAVVVSSAVDESNPEIREARRRQIPVIPRGELLAELMRLKYGIAIAGSHGKTTTTSMTAAVLSHAQMDPTVVVGGRVGSMGSNARLGRSDFLVVESDESDRSFLKLAPILAVVTNVDREHLDCYSSLDDIQNAFVEFVNKVPFYGAAILCVDDANTRAILPRVRRRTLTYGTDPAADLVASDVRCGHFASDFRLSFRGRGSGHWSLGEFHLNSAGAHNVLNAMAAVLVGLELEIPVEAIREGLAGFAGVDRRFQVRGREAGVTIIDDYGHHPSEIRATLAAARNCRFRRVHVLFQPHRYTRTYHLLPEFSNAFGDADALYLVDIYAAGEKPIEGVHASVLAERIRAAGHRDVRYFPSMDEAEAAIAQAVSDGDVVLTLGAGSVWQAGDKLLALLAHSAPVGTSVGGENGGSNR
jgi:UDP-N-acetylmuramate--alanine ligase